MTVRIQCDRCKKEIERYPSRIRPHNFCDRKCLAEFSNKAKNPAGYANLKNYENMSKNMTQLNYQLNPTRMDFPTRVKLRNSKLGKGTGKTYAKSFGVHTHRLVAARMLGRPLLADEVVHHIDGNKRNNRPDNLMVFENQADHAKWHSEHKGGDAT